MASDRPGAPWVELLAASPTNRAGRRRQGRQDHRRDVLAILRARHPALYVGEHGARLSAEEAMTLSGLLQDKVAAFTARLRLRFLAEGLHRGRARLGWDVAIPPPLTGVVRTCPVLTAERFSGLATLNDLIGRFTVTLSELPATPADRWGQLLFSIALFGGLADPKQWERFLAACTGGAIRHIGRCVWVDLEPKGEGHEGVERRIVLDPTTLALLRRLLATRPASAPCSAALCLRSYLRDLALDTQSVVSLAEFGTLVEARAALLMPGVVAAYAAGKSPAASLPPEVWERIVTGRPATRGGGGAPWAEQEAEEETIRAVGLRTSPLPGIGKPEIAVSIRLASLLRRILTNQGRADPADPLKILPAPSAHALTPDVAIKAVREALQAHGAAMTPVCRLLYCYALDRLRSRPRPERPGAKRSLRPRSVARYLSAVGGRLIAAAGTDDLLGWDAADLEEFYADVALDPDLGGADDTLRVQALADVHGYIAHISGVRVSFEGLGGSTRTAVDANLVTPRDFTRALALLGPDSRRRSPSRLQAIRRLTLILGYRLGLRRSEVRLLRVSDIVDGASVSELLIRPSRYHTLKSESAKRRLPLDALLHPDERNELGNWVQLRRKEEGAEPGKPCHALLFCLSGEPALPIAEGLVFSAIRDALMAVTGDHTLTFHALRHSFVSLMLLRLLVPDDADLSWLGILGRDPMMAPEARQELKKALLPSRSFGLSAVHAVSTLAGHSDCATSLRHYAHLFDVILAAFTARTAYQPLIPHTIAAHFADIAPATARQAAARAEMPKGRITIGTLEAGPVVDAVINLSIEDAPEEAIAPLVRTSAQRPGRRRIPAPDVTAPKSFSLPPWRLVQSVLGRLHAGETAEAIAKPLNADARTFQDWQRMAASVLKVRTKARRSKTPRHGGRRDPRDRRGHFPPMPRAGADIALTERIWRAADLALAKNAAAVEMALGSVTRRYNPSGGDIYFDEVAPAKAFLMSLRLLDVPPDHVIVFHYPRRGTAQEDWAKQSAVWCAALDIPATQCQPRGRNHFARRRLRNGAIGVSVVNGPAAGSSYGFRHAMLLLVIVLGARKKAKLGADTSSAS